MAAKLPPELLAYYDRVGAEVLNFRRAIVKIHKGHYYIERAIIKVDGSGTVTCSDKDLAPTKEEVEAIKKGLEGWDFPKIIEARVIDGLRMKMNGGGPLYPFYNRETGLITMVQERRSLPGDGKRYVPWVMLSDGDWMAMEPDGGLPFFKPREKVAGKNKIMVHEGAKAAAAAELIARDEFSEHPWAAELAEYEHWGLIGGALAPHRARYEELVREAPAGVVYVCDNDAPGLGVLPKFSKAWGRSLKGVRFNERFPLSWDMADPLPKNMFTKSGMFVGPSLGDYVEPATWATELLPIPEGAKGRPGMRVREEFAQEWWHIVTPEVYIHKDSQSHMLSAGEFNHLVGTFSGVEDTARLLRRDYVSIGFQLKYAPDHPSGLQHERGKTFINTFQPAGVKALEGDAAPWLDFMERLIPAEEDRDATLKWCATLIACPEVRIVYGLLMISEVQGVGKSTLGEKILAPLVGIHNCSFPTCTEIVDSQYNYWVAHKRLVVVNEVYAGHNAKAYDKLKSVLTDKQMTVSKKYLPNYSIECWAHMFACSNSMRALKLTVEDRRWLVPRLTEEKQPDLYWYKLNEWLNADGGLNIILHWAKAYVAEHGAIPTGAVAPWTGIKREMIEESFSPGQMLVSEVLGKIKDQVAEGILPKDIFTTDKALVGLIRNRLYDGRHNDHLEKPATVRAVAKACGWSIGEERLKTRAWGDDNFQCRIVALSDEIAVAGVKLHADGLAPMDLDAGSQM